MTRLAVVALALALLAAAPSAVPSAPDVLVLGDSYASGEGLPSASGPCGTEPDLSWGALVADGLGAASLSLLACSGAEVADVTVGGPLGRPAQLAEAAPADLVLLTLSGNDLGFTELVADCLGFADLGESPTAAALQDGGWSSLLGGDGIDTGCDVTQAELLERVAGFADDDRFPLPDGSTGSLADVYEAIVDAAVREGGRLVVVGYPSLFADVDQWEERYGRRCHGLRAADAEALAAVVVALDAAIAAAVSEADGRSDEAKVQHVPVLEGFVEPGDDHRLCGGGEPWINGLTVSEGGIDIGQLLAQLGAGPAGLDLEALGARPSGSFHPSTAGHEGIARLVTTALTN